MPADKETGRRVRMFGPFAATFLIFTVIPSVIAYKVGVTKGAERGRSEEIALREDVDRQLNDLGLCEWPRAFAKAHRCPEDKANAR